VAALAIAGLKAALITLYFMHARWSSSLTWLVIVAGLVWLGILLAGTMDDLLTRDWLPVSGT
jgi:cytochrome c oxidase subunit 4